MARWTRTVLRARWLVLALWLAVIGFGVLASLGLSRLTSNEFTVPGTQSEEARQILQRHFGDRSDGSFLVVFRTLGPARATPALARAMERGARAVPGGRAEPLRTAGDIAYGSIGSPLTLAQAKRYAHPVRRALEPPPGRRRSSPGRRRSSASSTRSSRRTSRRASRSRSRSRSSCSCSSSASPRS